MNLNYFRGKKKLSFKKLLQLSFFLMLLLTVLPIDSISKLYCQTSDSLYYKNFVVNSDGSYNSSLPPDVSFTVYLNKNEDVVLIENAPRWDPTGVPNIESNGTFGVELANFYNPDISVGDSIFIRFTNLILSEQGTLKDEITSIPFFYFPKTLKLVQTEIPSQPQFTDLVKNQNGSITLSWESIEGVAFDVYKTNLTDTLDNGQSRNLYKRIAQNLNSNTYTDTEVVDGETYEYIVYSINENGIKSGHSATILSSTGKIENLTAEAKPTSVFLRWDEYSNSDAETAGYNIYRRKENEGSPTLVGYTGARNYFVDSRLSLNSKYFYSVKARNKEGDEIAFSNEIEVTTLGSKNGYYSYATLKIGVVIYTNTTRGVISDGQVSSIKKGLNLGRLFYWRNSKMKLNVEFDYIIIDELIDFPDPEDSWGSMLLTGKHLDERGVKSTQYDIVFRVSRGVNGYWSYGVQDIGLTGPERSMGFSQIQWPVGTGVVYPGSNSLVSYGTTWVFVHEVQHALDAIFDNYSHPEENTIMYHGDAPWLFPVSCGEHYDFQAKMFRHYTGYEALETDWGEIYESKDNDNDDFPDTDSLVILDEDRFGSSNNLADTDNDGYTDRDEMFDGTFSGSDPTLADTDGDGKIDEQDSHPRYPIKSNTITVFTPVIDGTIDETWQAVNTGVIYNKEDYKPELYLSRDDNFLYLGLKIYNGGNPEIYFDFENDGFWYGSGNTVAKVDVNSGDFSSFRSRDSGEEVREYALAHDAPGGYWDDDTEYQNQFHRKVIYRDSVQLKVNKSGHITQIEMAIPQNEYAGINLSEGDKYGINIYYDDANGDTEQYASTFDQYSFVYFSVGNTTIIDDEQETLPTEFSLQQNYPNPFNPATNINYQVSSIENVTLTVYNSLGQCVAILVDEQKSPGVYEIKFNGINLSSGVYFYRLTAGSFVQTKKMILLK